MVFVGDILLPFRLPSGKFFCGQAGRAWSISCLRSHTGPAGQEAFLPWLADEATQQENKWEMPPVCLGEQGVDRKGGHGGLAPNLQAAQEPLDLPGEGRGRVPKGKEGKLCLTEVQSSSGDLMRSR